jgi:hypothetical protein
MPTRPVGLVVLLAAALTAAAVNAPADAQETTPSAVVARTFGQGNEISPTGAYEQGMAVGPWMVYPSVYGGAVYDNNSGQSPSGTDRASGFGFRLSPRLVATRSDGAIHATTVFGAGDLRFFNANTISADAGITHAYTPLQDLTLNLHFRYTRQTDLFTSALNFNNNAIGLHGGPAVPSPAVINPFGTSPSVNPIAYNQFTAGASVTKTLNQAFFTLTATAFHIAFDHGDDVAQPFQTSHDGTSFWLSGKAGYHFVPGVYGFVEATGIWQRFNNSVFDTNGYRVLGGIGTDDPNSLYRGEVYGGWQFQERQKLTGPSVSQDDGSPVAGLRVYYYPTEYWTWVASVDQVLGMSTFLTPDVPQGVPVVTTTAIVQTTYGLSQQWSLGARLGYTRADYSQIDRLDNGWMAGASLNYEIWRNLLLTLDYQHAEVASNTDLNDFSRDVYSAGLTYRY